MNRPTKRMRVIPEVVYISSDDDDIMTDDDDVVVKDEAVVEMELDQKTPLEVLPQVKINYSLAIEGVRVDMPVKPYPCQESVIKAIINGCQAQQHCLLESPTGSGKTLALLCGALAWQNDHAKKVLAEQDNKSKQSEESKNNVVPTASKETFEQSDNDCKFDDLDEFDWSDENFEYFNSRACQKIPTIYYGSRTHRQIDQVIKEFRRTVYTDKQMTILSSREITCIQDTHRDKTQLCNELLDPAKTSHCQYYTDNNRYTIAKTAALRAYGVESPWDIEDLVMAGKKAKACPYFAARSLMGDAEIIFCPYNYIIDPVIRESMQIDLRGSIIILDEAHNIENICRECGSVSLTIDEIAAPIQECESILQQAAISKQFYDFAYVSVIEEFCENLHAFVNATPLKPQPQSESFNSDRWSGAEFVNVLEIAKSIRLPTIMNFIKAASEAIIKYGLGKESLRNGVPTAPTLSNEGINIVEKILMGFKMVTSIAYASDYRVVVRQTPQGYKQEKYIEFMCMNSGVIFAPICNLARTVILASGTLAPTKSYQGELGVKFHFTIQANHVTPQEQVLIKCVSKGTTGNSLRANYQNVNTWSFQDDIGQIVLTACEAIPHGILMFFSSYTVMGNFIKRWNSSGMVSKLARVKEIFQETRGSADISSMMENYRLSIKNTSNGPVDGVTGALLFAVFRGKVAEGIDFSDNEARCVLTVGIPYAVRNDPATDMKFQYNDLNRNKGLSSGNEWYTIQAFRALNQALGRVIRHRNDWGAIVLIDDRFTEVRNIQLLPAWVQTMWDQQSKVQIDLRQLFKAFVARQIKREKQKIRELSSDSI